MNESTFIGVLGQGCVVVCEGPASKEPGKMVNNETLGYFIVRSRAYWHLQVAWCILQHSTTVIRNFSCLIFEGSNKHFQDL